MGRWWLTSLLLACIFVSGAPDAAAQAEYPPPVPSDACVTVQGEGGNTGLATFRTEITIEGRPGCAASNGEVVPTVFSDPVRLAAFFAREDGSFRKSYCLPPAVEPGEHAIEVDMEGRGMISRDLTVEDGDGECLAAGDGTAVLGAGKTNTDDSSGVLPRTGTDIARFILWAILLMSLGAALVVGTWQSRERLAPVTLHRRPVMMLPAPEIPRIDTSRFVPSHSRYRRPADDA